MIVLCPVGILESHPGAIDSSPSKSHLEMERELEKKDKKKGCPQITWLKDHWRKSKKEKDQQPMSAFLAFTTEAMKLLEEEQYLQLKKKEKDPLKLKQPMSAFLMLKNELRAALLAESKVSGRLERS
ncbi:hypothetical protein CsSME_00017159 [Camellia sinensis var. sinensis]